MTVWSKELACTGRRYIEEGTASTFLLASSFRYAVCQNAGVLEILAGKEGVREGR